MKPSWRKPAGIFLILAIIAIWAVLVASYSATIGNWPMLLQALFYTIAGIAWIFPVRPVLVWMETGRWRIADQAEK
ncbi:MAG: DUF2842 domain-containing protein [Blastomonas sp.]